MGNLLTKWWKDGTAAGNVGDWYDNRDREHSPLDVRVWPQLQKVKYSDKEIKLRRDWALSVVTRPHVTFGNSSTSGPAETIGSNPRSAYTSPEEARGRRLGDLIVPDELLEEEQRLAGLVLRGQRVEVETVRRRKDGSRLHVSLVRVPVTVPGGQVEVYAIHNDVSERKRAEAELRELAGRLQALSRRLLEVQELERRHLARELHDEVGQLLTGLRLLLSPNGDLTSEAARARVEQARAIVDELLERVRGLSFDLRPAALDQFGLLPALAGLFERYSASTGVRVNFQSAGLERRFAPEVETAAYRIVQEALTNVARHARVGEVAVRLWVNADTLMIQVEDQGAGFDPEAVLAAGRSGGLPGMYERVKVLGGRLAVESAPGSGAHLLAELPLDGPRGGNGP